MLRSNPRPRSADSVIEVSIPMRLVRGAGLAGAEDDDITCYICANSFCASEACSRSLTHLGCCTQSICCGCLAKSSKRCRCKEDCDAVVSLCPFCREVSAVDALDMFLGHQPVCAACAKGDEPAVPVPPPPQTPGGVDDPEYGSLLARLGVVA